MTILLVVLKYKRFKKIAWIWSLHLQWEIQIWAQKLAWGVKAKQSWALSPNFSFSVQLTGSKTWSQKIKQKKKFCFFMWFARFQILKMWTTKHLAQASCTELTSPESVIGPNRGKMYQCSVLERENWCPFVWWCHKNDVPRYISLYKDMYKPMCLKF